MNGHFNHLSRNDVNRHLTERGFTLLEIAIAVAILGIAFSTLLTLQTFYMRQYVRERDMLKASLIAQYMMTLLEVETTPPDIGGTSGSVISALQNTGYFGDDSDPREEDLLEGWDYTQEVSEVAIPGGGEKEVDALRRIDLTVRWGTAGDEQYSLTYLMKTKAD